MPWFFPALAWLGFGPLGPVTGGLAALFQGLCIGALTPAGSLFAFLQAAAMKGAGLSAGLAAWMASWM
ncbi:hypothetical protein P8C59_008346 [Phyllachora maydis]|uniref:Uncharacterized protein n=1 Tax=Phyllachora maydis TaxID=1825666 RepID=A0AAD9MGQ5_9PEZI|nr:hypothetical protein P8C59_008346 [Phyllachora maydis]